MPTANVQLTPNEMEQSLYTLEMCITTLMANQMEQPMKPKDDQEAHTHVYGSLMNTTTKLRAALTNLGVSLEQPLYHTYMQPQGDMRLSA